MAGLTRRAGSGRRLAAAGAALGGARPRLDVLRTSPAHRGAVRHARPCHARELEGTGAGLAHLAEPGADAGLLLRGVEADARGPVGAGVHEARLARAGPV